MDITIVDMVIINYPIYNSNHLMKTVYPGNAALSMIVTRYTIVTVYEQVMVCCTKLRPDDGGHS
jgi:hypothetical protein